MAGPVLLGTSRAPVVVKRASFDVLRGPVLLSLVLWQCGAFLVFYSTLARSALLLAEAIRVCTVHAASTVASLVQIQQLLPLITAAVLKFWSTAHCSKLSSDRGDPAETPETHRAGVQTVAAPQ